MQDNTLYIASMATSKAEVADEEEETLLSLKLEVTLNTLSLVHLNSNQPSG